MTHFLRMLRIATALPLLLVFLSSCSPEPESSADEGASLSQKALASLGADNETSLRNGGDMGAFTSLGAPVFYTGPSGALGSSTMRSQWLRWEDLGNGKSGLVFFRKNGRLSWLNEKNRKLEGRWLKKDSHLCLSLAGNSLFSGIDKIVDEAVEAESTLSNVDPEFGCARLNPTADGYNLIYPGTTRVHTELTLL